MHVHNFKYGHRGVLSYCDIKTGVMQRCNAPNPEWASVIRKAPLVVERDYDGPDYENLSALRGQSFNDDPYYDL